MEAGKNIVERILIEDNARKTCQAEFHWPVITIAGKFAALLAVIPVDQPDFVSFYFKSGDTSFTDGTAGVENTWNGETVIETTAQTDFFAPFVAGGEFDFHC